MSVAGGGDTVAALAKAGAIDSFNSSTPPDPSHSCVMLSRTMTSYFAASAA
jgi:hypothetical protein